MEFNIPVVTSAMLAQQRYEFSIACSRGYMGDWYRDIRSDANYFAPNRWTMYEPIDGTQDRLWMSRWDDGAIWSGLLARDLAHSNWMRDLIYERR